MKLRVGFESQSRQASKGAAWWMLAVLVAVSAQSLVVHGDRRVHRLRAPRNLLRQDFSPPESAPRWRRRSMPIVQMPLQHQTLTLRCEASGRPRPTVDWLKNGRPVHYSDKVTKGKFSLTMVDLISAYDRGNYTCLVSNRLGDLNHTFIVDVVVRFWGQPQITQGPTNQTALEGDSVELRCNYFSDLEAFVQWFKYHQVNGSLFDSFGNAYATSVQLSGEANLTDETRLLLRNVSAADVGLYSCHVTNSLGSTASYAWVDVISAPVAPAPPAPPGAHTDPRLAPAVACAVAGAFLLVSTAVVLFICCRPKRRLLAKIVFAGSSLGVGEQGGSEAYYNTRGLGGGRGKVGVRVPLDSKWEISPKRLQIAEALGEGAFGKVYKGQLRTHGQGVTVAVKMLKDEASEKEVVDFVNEISMMKSIGRHINVVSFLGCCTQHGPLRMVVEYAAHGNLREFLRLRRAPRSPLEDPSEGEEPPQPLGGERGRDGGQLLPPLTHSHLVSFCYQVARGMQHLVSRKIIHRDLACRNVLVADDLIAKIADFGMTRIVCERDLYKRRTGGRFPIKWMSPESLSENSFSSKSDVWSFGVLMWEVFTLGSTPYKALPIQTLPSLLKEGHRLERPQIATADIYETMMQCWQYTPADRPIFEDLVLTLDTMLTSSTAVLSMMPFQTLLRQWIVTDPSPEHSPIAAPTASSARGLAIRQWTAGDLVFRSLAEKLTEEI